MTSYSFEVGKVRLRIVGREDGRREQVDLYISIGRVKHRRWSR